MRRYFHRALRLSRQALSPAFTATAPNIAADRETGLGGWTDSEIKRAQVEGMRPNPMLPRVISTPSPRTDIQSSRCGIWQPP